MKFDNSPTKILADSLVLVFKKPQYFLLALIFGFLILVLAIWLPNFSFLKYVSNSDIYTFSDKFNIFKESFGLLNSNFTFLNRILTVIIAIVSGINLSMLVYYVKNKIRMARSAGASIFGTVTGLIGVGCASCGSVILSSVIGIGLSSRFISKFPLNGSEFSIAGIFIVLFAIYSLSKKINNPSVCNIDNKGT